MAAGDISFLDKLDIDNEGYYPTVAHVTNNVFVIMYGTAGSAYMEIRTVSVDAAGNITSVDYWDTSTYSITQFLFKIAGNVFALAYQASGGVGILKTFTVADNGTITKSFIATHTFASGSFPNSVYLRDRPLPLGGNIWAIACQASNDVRVYTVSISDDGATMSNIDAGVFSVTQNKGISMCNANGNIYALVTQQLVNSTQLFTFEIASGVVTNKDSLVLAAAYNNAKPGIAKLADGVIVICHNGSTMQTRAIAADGTIGSQLDSSTGAWWYLLEVPDADNVYAYQSGANVYTKTYLADGTIGSQIDSESSGLTGIGTVFLFHGEDTMWLSATVADPTLDVWAVSFDIKVTQPVNQVIIIP